MSWPPAQGPWPWVTSCSESREIMTPDLNNTVFRIQKSVQMVIWSNLRAENEPLWWECWLWSAQFCIWRFGNLLCGIYSVFCFWNKHTLPLTRVKTTSKCRPPSSACLSSQKACDWLVPLWLTVSRPSHPERWLIWMMYSTHTLQGDVSEHAHSLLASQRDSDSRSLWRACHRAVSILACCGFLLLTVQRQKSYSTSKVLMSRSPQIWLIFNCSA